MLLSLRWDADFILRTVTIQTDSAQKSFMNCGRRAAEDCHYVVYRPFLEPGCHWERLYSDCPAEAFDIDHRISRAIEVGQDGIVRSQC